jgi:poly(ADP-ribose) glycohydrolase ARH3
VTHTHPEGRDGAVLLACAVHVALGTPPDRALPGPPPDVREHLRSAAFRTALARLASPAPGHERLAQARTFGTPLAARTSVPAAIAVALAHGDDVVAAIRAAVGLGGDTDTVAAMAGAVVGAHVGADAFPPEPLSRLERRETIEASADRLVAAAA